ncbi:hypothetical protein PQS90_18120 [Pseudomonas sp. BLCC-B13]|uniref:hypothetical protein n=1 Tax=Pseudomonas sp. BLCC-B13 TaxID=3025314 RepID=UPI00234E92E3|nr:hypothetical protein [Pseudomonas sp. BLCC-B13]MDC7827075.1 hypothetical protein [Pseudomonas sp. BLCC-B13]
MNRVCWLGLIAFVSACSSVPVAYLPTSGQEIDPQRCIERADCTTKVSRTLLFVFDYAAAGGQLVQRQDRLLFTPADAPPSDWPAIYIRLAEPADSRFDFNAECRSARCRYDAQQLLRVYRSYLAGAPCSLLLGAAIESCTAR